MAATPLLSVVAPAYNEQECLAEFVGRTDQVLRGMGESYEIIVVNDGSEDATLSVALGLTNRFPHLTVANLSRNFGQQTAFAAGIDTARGSAVVLMDVDLQDPPELIPELVAKWREGFHVVFAQRRQREGETWLKKATSWAFYRLMRRATGLDLPPDTGDFRLMDRKAVDAFRRMPERHRLTRAMVTWLGFRQTGVPFDRAKRLAGNTKYNFRKMTRLAVDAMFSFTTSPLRLATRLGLVMSMFGLLGFLWLFVQKLFPQLGDLLPRLSAESSAYALLMCSIFLIGGVQCLMIGVLGEYVGRIYEEVQRRPLYLIEGLHGGRGEPDPEPAAADSEQDRRSAAASPRRHAPHQPHSAPHF